jgi:allophanate hydrolase subunit 1
MKVVKKLTEQELTKIQEMNTTFTQAKIALGDLEIQKHSILGQIKQLRDEFSENEKELIERYGSDAVINIKTGEVTYGKD